MTISWVAVIAMGLYAYNLRTENARSGAALAQLQQSRDMFRNQLDEVGGKLASATVALASCNGQLKDAQIKGAPVKRAAAP
jgi:hypothetical protein